MPSGGVATYPAIVTDQGGYAATLETAAHEWVHHYLMEATGGDTAAHDREYDRVEWRPLDAATKALSFKNEVDMVVKARARLEGKA